MSTPAQSRAEVLLSAEKRMLEAIANRVSLLEVLDDLCRTIDAHSPGVISSVALMDADGKRLWLGAGPRFPAELKPVAFPWPIGPGRGACGTAAFLKQRVTISDITIDPRWPDDCRDLPVSCGLRAAWSEPLISKGGAVLGTFAMYYGEPRIPDTSDLELIEAAGHIARIAIEAERSQVALGESEKRFRLAAQAGKMFAYEWDAATDTIVRSGESAKILGIDEAAPLTGHQAISRVHPDDREGLLTAMAGLAPEKPFLQVTYRIVRTDESVIWVERHSRAHFDEYGKIKRIVGMIVDITERKRAEVALLRHAAIVESSDDAIVGTDVSGTVTDWNKGAERLFGYLATEAIGRHISFLAATDRPDEGQAILKKVMNGDVVTHYETVGQRKDGSRVDISLTVSSIVDADGRVVGASGIARDITERKRAEEELRESEERFRSLYENSTLGLYRTTSDGKILLANPSLVKMLGFSSFSELAQRNLEEEGFEPGYERAEFKHRLATEGEVKGLEASWMRRDGTAIFVRESAKAMRDAEGKIAYYEGTVEDITERKLAEQELAIASERLHLAINSGSVGGWDYDLNTGKKVWFGKTHAQLGMAPDEPPGSFEESWDRIHKDDREHLQHALRVARDKHEQFTEEFRVVWRDGTTRWVRSQGRYFYAANGEPERLLGLSVDITQRKLAEEALQESEKRFRLVANTAPVMIWMSGLDKKPTYFNQLWLDFTGLAEADLQNGLAGIVHPEDYPQCHEDYCRGFDQRQPFRKECRLRRHDGEYRWILDIGVPRFHKDGSFAGYIGSCIDITERKRAEEALSGMTKKLVEAQEQERARIARELHDDINQRIALLAIELDQLREKHKDLPFKVRRHVQELQQMAADICSGVYALSHELYSSIPDSLGLAKGMRSWCREFGKKQKMEIDLKSHDLPRLPQEISFCLFRVLQEALRNAAKHSGVKRVEVQLAENSGEVHLIVSDSGRGFDIEAARQSRGLGLTGMQERVRLVGGTIVIDAKPLAGTTIHVCVPFKPDPDVRWLAT